jgi:hypothetical protein
MMNDKLLMELLDEIDAMSPGEYWELYRESQELPDFVPPDMDEVVGLDMDDFISVRYNNILVTLPDSTFNTETNVAVLSVETDIVVDGSSLWPMAA